MGRARSVASAVAISLVLVGCGDGNGSVSSDETAPDGGVAGTAGLGLDDDSIPIVEFVDQVPPLSIPEDYCTESDIEPLPLSGYGEWVEPAWEQVTITLDAVPTSDPLAPEAESLEPQLSGVLQDTADSLLTNYAEVWAAAEFLTTEPNARVAVLVRNGFAGAFVGWSEASGAVGLGVCPAAVGSSLARAQDWHESMGGRLSGQELFDWLLSDESNDFESKWSEQQLEQEEAAALALDPMERVLHSPSPLPESVTRDLENTGIRVSVPTSWVGESWSVCLRLARGWNPCLPLNERGVADDGSSAPIPVFVARGEPLEVWLLGHDLEAINEGTSDMFPDPTYVGEVDGAQVLDDVISEIRITGELEPYRPGHTATGPFAVEGVAG